MPKSNVFIIWNEREIADEVKRRIESEDPEYRVFIGGDTGTDTSLTVPGTIIEELKQCDQAIALIDGRYRNVTNPNVMYELGFAISIYGLERTSIFLIGCTPDDLPSDMKGLWMKSIIPVKSIDDSLTAAQRGYVELLEKSDDVFLERLIKSYVAECRKSNYFADAAKKASKKFLDNNHAFKTEKMKIILRYYRYRELLTNWSQSPSLLRYRCSEKDLSFFLLFFVQAAEFYDDYKDLRSAIQRINKYRASLCQMLQDSIDFSLAFLDFFLSIKSNENEELDFNYQLDEDTFFRVRNRLTALKKNYEDRRSGEKDRDDLEFSRWLIVSVDEILPYLYLVRANSTDDLDAQRELFQKVIDCAKACEQKCEEIRKQKNKNDQNILNLFQAYNYRNLSSALIRLGRNSEAKEAIRKSYDLRCWLYQSYCNDPTVPDAIERVLKMEYFLSWYECKTYLDEAGSEEEGFHEPMIAKEVERFLRKEQFYDKRIRFYTDRIKKLVETN